MNYNQWLFGLKEVIILFSYLGIEGIVCVQKMGFFMSFGNIVCLYMKEELEEDFVRCWLCLKYQIELVYRVMMLWI